MRYYFSKKQYDKKSYSKSSQLKELKKSTERQLNEVKSKIEQVFNLNLEYAWISKSTFGNVFVDFVPEKTGPVLLGTHKKLFDLIKNEINYLIISREISRNFLKKKVDDIEVLAINVDYYKMFIKSFANQEKRVKLYLYKLTKTEEHMINNWININPTQNKDKKISEEDLLSYLSSMNIDSVEKFTSFMYRINSSLENNVSANLSLYQNSLNEFKRLINDETINEIELSNFLHKHIWLLDFRYLKLDKCEREFETEVGDIDIYISREQFNIKKDIVIELKVPKDRIIKKYRGKPAFTAEVGNAISQVINYMETQKENNKILDGLLILGRKDEEFIHLLNDHLSKIKIITYDEIAEKCQKILDVFRVDKKLEDI